MVDLIVFVVSAAIILLGATGVIISPNPVRAALCLIASFFGVAVLFVQQAAHFLAITQVVVYGGAVVVLFLFVIMLLGVDKVEDINLEPLVGQRLSALVVSLALIGLIMSGLFVSGATASHGGSLLALTGESAKTAPLSLDENYQAQVVSLAEDLFTRNVMAFQATALLLTIATVGAVVMVRNNSQRGEDQQW